MDRTGPAAEGRRGGPEERPAGPHPLRPQMAAAMVRSAQAEGGVGADGGETAGVPHDEKTLERGVRKPQPCIPISDRYI